MISCWQKIFLIISQYFKDKIESIGLLFLQGKDLDRQTKMEIGL